MTLAILSLLAGIAFPAVEKAMRRGAFIEAAARFEALLHGARATAIRMGKPTRFDVSTDHRSFGYRGLPDRLPETMAARATDGPIGFFPDGTSTGGRLEITEPGETRRWVVHPATGSIERTR